MSLEGAKFICLDAAGNHGEVVVARGRRFTMGYYVNCDYIMADERAKGVHCEIVCDPFGRVTIRNFSPDKPILINGSPVEIKRILLNNSKLSILDKEYLWQFSKGSSNEFEVLPSDAASTTPDKLVGIPEQPPNSCPDFKLHRELPKRFTVHNFAYCIQSDEDGNISTDSNDENVTEDKEKNQNKIKDEKKVIEPNENPIAIDDQKDLKHEDNSNSARNRSVTPEPQEEKKDNAAALLETPKMNLINFTKDKENNSTEKKNKQLSLCYQSDVVITSFSPRETGVKTERSFATIIKPKVLVTKPPTTPKSVYSTPKTDIHDDDEKELINFYTPSTSKKGTSEGIASPKIHKNSSMHLIDLTTPNKLVAASPYLKSALKASTKKNLAHTADKSSIKLPLEEQLGLSVLPSTPVGNDSNKCSLETPSSVISVSSTDTSSVVEVTSDGSNLGITPSTADGLTTPIKPQIAIGACTPRRTPQSLMKRALLTSAKKHGTTPQRGITPHREPINRIPLRSQLASLGSPVTPKASTADKSDLQLTRKRSMSTPTRKSFSARNRFDNSPSTSTSSPSSYTSLATRRSSLNPISADKSLPTSTPVASSSNSSLHKVRKHVAGKQLSSHISKPRRSLALPASSCKFTSVKEKSPQQVMSKRLVTRARKSVCVTPTSARARNMVAAAKTPLTCPPSILKYSKLECKTTEQRKALLFVDKQSTEGEELDDLNSTFVIDLDEEENVEKKDKPKDATFSPNKSDKKSDETDNASTTINTTFSPEKKKEENVEIKDKPKDVTFSPDKSDKKSDETNNASTTINTTFSPEKNLKNIEKSKNEEEDAVKPLEIPLDVEEITETQNFKIMIEQNNKCEKTKDHTDIIGKESEINNESIKKNSTDSKSNDKGTIEKDIQTIKDNVVHPLAVDNKNDTLVTEESFAEIINDNETEISEQVKESTDQTSYKKTDVLESGFGEESLVEILDTSKQNETADNTDDNAKSEEIVLTEEDKLDDMGNAKTEFNANESIVKESIVEEVKVFDNSKIESKLNNYPKAETMEENKTIEELKSDEYRPIYEDITLEGSLLETEAKEEEPNLTKQPVYEDITLEGSVLEETDRIVKEIKQNESDQEVPKNSEIIEHFELQVSTESLNETDLSTGGKEEIKLSKVEAKISNSCQEIAEQLKNNETSEEQQAQTDNCEKLETTNKNDEPKDLQVVEEILPKKSEESAKKIEMHIDVQEKKDSENIEQLSLNNCETNTLGNLNETKTNDDENTNKLLEEIEDVLNKSDEIKQKHLDEIKEQESETPLTEEFESEEIASLNNENVEELQDNQEERGEISDKTTNDEIENKDCEDVSQQSVAIEINEEEEEGISDKKVKAEVDKNVLHQSVVPQIESISDDAINANKEQKEEVFNKSTINGIESNKAVSETNEDISISNEIETNIIVEEQQKNLDDKFTTDENYKSTTDTIEELQDNLKESTNIQKKGEIDEKSTIQDVDEQKTKSKSQRNVQNQPQKNIVKSTTQSHESIASNVTDTTSETTKNNDDIPSVSSTKKKIDMVSAGTPRRLTRRSSLSAETSTIAENINTPRRGTRRASHSAETSSTADSTLLTPRRTSRRTSVSAETSTIQAAEATLTPRRSTRRASMTLESTNTHTPSKKNTRRTSISAISEAPLTPKRITSLRSSVDVDDEHSKILHEAQTPRAKTPRKQLEQRMVIPEEISEDMGAIIEEAEEIDERKLAVKEVVPEETLASDKNEVSAETDVSESNEREMAQNPKVSNTKKTEETEIEEEETATTTTTVDAEEATETPETLETKKPKRKQLEEETALQTLQERNSINIGDQKVSETSQALTINKPVKLEEKEVDEEITSQTLEEELEEPATAYINFGLTETAEDWETKETDEIEMDEGIRLQISEDEVEDTKTITTNAADISTAKVKKSVKIVADSPKTPIMIGVRELLKTPKGEINSPKFVGIRNLVRSPKLTDENDEEEIEKLAVVAELVKTPQATISEDLEEIDDRPTTSTVVADISTPKAKKTVKIMADSPKTPAMTGMRELLKTPKAEVITPRLTGKRNLIRTPKSETENKEEETKKLAVIAELVKTPQDLVEPKTSAPDAEVSTPKSKKSVKIIADSPKTPVMTGIRELLKTPKADVNTPKFVGIRHLVQTPKSTPDTEEEEIEKLAGVADLVKTPQTTAIITQEIATTSTKDAKLKGVKELLKTPKSCSTPRFKGMRELMQTPKMCSTPLMEGIKELMHSPVEQKHHDSSQLENDNLDKFLKTPTAKNIMISSLPSSAIIEKNIDSIEVSTEYDLNSTHERGSANLEELFKTPVASRFVERITASYYGGVEEEHDETVENFNKMETLQESLNKSAEEAFDKLVGQESQIQTPIRKVFQRKSLALHTPQAQSPFSAADVLSDLPKTDVEEWIETLDQAEPPTILEGDDKEVVDKGNANESTQEVPEEDEVSCLEDSIVDQDKNLAENECIIPETCAKVYLSKQNVSNVTTASEVMFTLSTIKKTSTKDPLASATTKLKPKEIRPTSPIDAEISGIDLLEQTVESVQDELSLLEEPLLMEEPSMFEEHLVVSDNESEADVTINNPKETKEEEKSLANDTLDNEEDANDLSEPLLVSDSDDLNLSQEFKDTDLQNDVTTSKYPLEFKQMKLESESSSPGPKVEEKSMLEEEQSKELFSARDPLESQRAEIPEEFDVIDLDASDMEEVINEESKEECKSMVEDDLDRNAQNEEKTDSIIEEAPALHSKDIENSAIEDYITEIPDVNKKSTEENSINEGDFVIENSFIEINESKTEKSLSIESALEDSTLITKSDSNTDIIASEIKTSTSETSKKTDDTTTEALETQKETQQDPESNIVATLKKKDVEKETGDQISSSISESVNYTEITEAEIKTSTSETLNKANGTTAEATETQTKTEKDPESEVTATSDEKYLEKAKPFEENEQKYKVDLENQDETSISEENYQESAVHLGTEDQISTSIAESVNYTEIKTPTSNTLKKTDDTTTEASEIQKETEKHTESKVIAFSSNGSEKKDVPAEKYLEKENTFEETVQQKSSTVELISEGSTSISETVSNTEGTAAEIRASPSQTSKKTDDIPTEASGSQKVTEKDPESEVVATTSDESEKKDISAVKQDQISTEKSPDLEKYQESEVVATSSKLAEKKSISKENVKLFEENESEDIFMDTSVTETSDVVDKSAKDDGVTEEEKYEVDSENQDKTSILEENYQESAVHLETEDQISTSIAESVNYTEINESEIKTSISKTLKKTDDTTTEASEIQKETEKHPESEIVAFSSNGSEKKDVPKEKYLKKENTFEETDKQKSSTVELTSEGSTSISETVSNTKAIAAEIRASPSESLKKTDDIPTEASDSQKKTEKDPESEVVATSSDESKKKDISAVKQNQISTQKSPDSEKYQESEVVATSSKLAEKRSISKENVKLFEENESEDIFMDTSVTETSDVVDKSAKDDGVTEEEKYEVDSENQDKTSILEENYQESAVHLETEDQISTSIAKSVNYTEINESEIKTSTSKTLKKTDDTTTEASEVQKETEKHPESEIVAFSSNGSEKKDVPKEKYLKKENTFKQTDQRKSSTVELTSEGSTSISETVSNTKAIAAEVRASPSESLKKTDDIPTKASDSQKKTEKDPESEVVATSSDESEKKDISAVKQDQISTEKSPDSEKYQESEVVATSSKLAEKKSISKENVKLFEENESEDIFMDTSVTETSDVVDKSVKDDEITEEEKYEVDSENQDKTSISEENYQESAVHLETEDQISTSIAESVIYTEIKASEIKTSTSKTLKETDDTTTEASEIQKKTEKHPGSEVFAISSNVSEKKNVPKEKYLEQENTFEETDKRKSLTVELTSEGSTSISETVSNTERTAAEKTDDIPTEASESQKDPESEVVTTSSDESEKKDIATVKQDQISSEKSPDSEKYQESEVVATSSKLAEKKSISKENVELFKENESEDIFMDASVTETSDVVDKSVKDEEESKIEYTQCMKSKSKKEFDKYIFMDSSATDTFVDEITNDEKDVENESAMVEVTTKEKSSNDSEIELSFVEDKKANGKEEVIQGGYKKSDKKTEKYKKETVNETIQTKAPVTKESICQANKNEKDNNIEQSTENQENSETEVEQKDSPKNQELSVTCQVLGKALDVTKEKPETEDLSSDKELSATFIEDTPKDDNIIQDANANVKSTTEIIPTDIIEADHIAEIDEKLSETIAENVLPHVSEANERTELIAELQDVNHEAEVQPELEQNIPDSDFKGPSEDINAIDKSGNDVNQVISDEIKAEEPNSQLEDSINEPTREQEYSMTEMKNENFVDKIEPTTTAENKSKLVEKLKTESSEDKPTLPTEKSVQLEEFKSIMEDPLIGTQNEKSTDINKSEKPLEDVNTATSQEIPSKDETAGALPESIKEPNTSNYNIDVIKTYGFEVKIIDSEHKNQTETPSQSVELQKSTTKRGRGRKGSQSSECSNADIELPATKRGRKNTEEESLEAIVQSAEDIQKPAIKRGRRKPTVSESSQGSVHEDDSKATSVRKGRRDNIRTTPIEKEVLEKILENEEQGTVSTVIPPESHEDVKANEYTEIQDSSNKERTDVQSLEEKYDIHTVIIEDVKKETVKPSRRERTASESSQDSINDDNNYATRRGRRKVQKPPVVEPVAEENTDNEEQVMATGKPEDTLEQKLYNEAPQTASSEEGNKELSAVSTQKDTIAENVEREKQDFIEKDDEYIEKESEIQAEIAEAKEPVAKEPVSDSSRGSVAEYGSSTRRGRRKVQKIPVEKISENVETADQNEEIKKPEETSLEHTNDKIKSSESSESHEIVPQNTKVTGNLTETAKVEKETEGSTENLEQTKVLGAKRSRRKPTASESSQGSTHDDDTKTIRRVRRKVQKTPVEEPLVEEKPENELLTILNAPSTGIEEVVETSNTPQTLSKEEESTKLLESESREIIEIPDPLIKEKVTKEAEVENSTVDSDSDSHSRIDLHQIQKTRDILKREELPTTSKDDKEKQVEPTEDKPNATQEPMESSTKAAVTHEDIKDIPAKRGRRKPPTVSKSCQGSVHEENSTRRGRRKAQITTVENLIIEQENQIENLPSVKVDLTETIAIIDDVRETENSDEESKISELKKIESKATTTQELSAETSTENEEIVKQEVDESSDKPKEDISNSAHTTRRVGRRKAAETASSKLDEVEQTNETTTDIISIVTTIEKEQKDTEIVDIASCDQQQDDNSSSAYTSKGGDRRKVALSESSDTEVTTSRSRSRNRKTPITEAHITSNTNERRARHPNQMPEIEEVAVEESELKGVNVGKEKSTELLSSVDELVETSTSHPKEEEHKDEIEDEDEEIEHKPESDDKIKVSTMEGESPEKLQKSSRRRGGATTKDHVEHQVQLPTKSRRARGKPQDIKDTQLIEEVEKESESNKLSEVHITAVNLELDDHTSTEEKDKEVRSRRGRKHVIAEDHHHEKTKPATKRRAAAKHFTNDHEESGSVSKRRVGRKNQEQEDNEPEVLQEETSEPSDQTTVGRRKQNSVQEEHHDQDTLVTAEDSKHDDEISEKTSTTYEGSKKGRVRTKKDNHDLTTHVTADDSDHEEKFEDTAPYAKTKKGRTRKKKEELQTETHVTADDSEQHEEKSVVTAAPEKRRVRRKIDEHPVESEHPTTTSQPRGRKRKVSHTDIEDDPHSDEIVIKSLETKVKKLKDEIAPHTPQRAAASRRGRKASAIDADKNAQIVTEISDDSPSKRPSRKAATAYHNYDETSDTEKPTKKKTDSPRKSLEVAKSKPTATVTSALVADHSSPSSSTPVATTARGRTRKPTARVQQFLEEERAKAETPKKRGLLAVATALTDTPTPQRLPGRRGRKASTIETDVDAVGTPQAIKRGRGKAAVHSEDHKETVTEETEHTTPPATTSAKGRRGGRKAKTSAEDNLHDEDEPLGRKSPFVLKAEKQETSPEVEGPTPTRTTGKRNAAAAAKARIEEDALAAAAIDPPKRPKTKKFPAAKAAAATEDDHSSEQEEEQNKTKSVKGPKNKSSSTQKREHRLTSASTVEGAEDLNTEEENESDIIRKPAAKRGARNVAPSTTTDSPAVPAKRGRRAKIESNETETVVDPKTTRGAGRGRKNVHFNAESSTQQETSAEEKEHNATSEQSAEESSAPVKRSARTRRK